MIMTDVFEYSIKHHARARHIRIKVNGLGGVEVVAPHGASSREIDGFVRKSTDWIYKTIEKLKDDRLEHPDRGFKPPTNISLPAISKHYSVNYTFGIQKATVKEQGSMLFVCAANENEHVVALRTWIQKKAKHVLTPWLKVVADLHNISFNKVTIRGQKTRWGSCSSQHNINLNRNLLFLAPDLVNYLMVHELSHVIQPNHSSLFWAQVAKCEPNYQILDKSLNKSSKQVPLWAYQAPIPD